MEHETLTLKPSIFKLLLLFSICAGFVYLGITLILQNNIVGWISVVFFGICLTVTIIQFIPNSSYLKLTKEGFEIKTLFKSSFTKWKDVEGFTSGRIVLNKVVKFNFSKHYSKHKKLKQLNKRISGNEAALPDTYGLKVKDLANLMNEWQQKYSEI